MAIFDEGGSPIESPDLGRGRLVRSPVVLTWEYRVTTEGSGHWETVATYPSGGEDVEWRWDVPEEGEWVALDPDGSEVNLSTYDGYRLPDDSWDTSAPVETTWQNRYVYVPYTEEEQAEADAAREEERVARELPAQMAALARMQVSEMDLTSAPSSTIAAFRDLWPEWTPDTKYRYQQPLRHKGLYYRASKALTSSKVYPPDTAGESEYYPVEVAPDGIIVYRECHGQYDMVQEGETRHWPDADGPVYLAKVDTAYDPGERPDDWEAVGGDAA